MSTELSAAQASPDPEVPIWARPQPGARRTRFSRDEIAAAAVRIADTDGIDAVSMRRIAAELGAGTMTLYHYVSTKAELFALVTDAVIAENVVPHGEMPTEWRAAVTAIAVRTRATLNRHPWIFDIVDDPGYGPNAVKHFEQSLQAVSSLDIDLRARVDIIAVVDEYTFGYCMRERDNERVARGDDAAHDVNAYLEDMIRTGDFPCLAELLEEHGMEQAFSQIAAHLADHGRFERNLARLLDGIEHDLLR